MPISHSDIPHSPRARGAHAFVAALMLVSAALFVGRTLNFDEWLLLRASWLIGEGMPGNIPFLMPLSALLSIPTHWDLPATVLVPTLRLTSAAFVMACLWLAFTAQSRDRLTALLAMTLTVSNGAFFSHGLELRYDLAILCGWLLAWRLWSRPGAATSLWLGVLAAFIAAHHTKGVFYAATLSIGVLMLPGRVVDNVRRFVAGGLAGAVAWLGWLMYHDQMEAAWVLYRTFSQLGLSHERVHAWTSLAPRVEADLTWWLVAAAAATSRVVRLRRAALPRWAWMVLPPVAFILMHPHPWDYLLAPVIPFLAYWTAQELCHWLDRTPAFAPGVAAAWGCALMAALLWLPTAQHAWASRQQTDLQTLNLVQQFAQPDDVVLDPTGAVYMLAPVRPDWYRDTLWQYPQPTTAEARGFWRQATWAVASYRLKWVDGAWQDELRASHAQACGWLWLRKDDTRLQHVRRSCPDGAVTQLHNYWQRSR